MSHAPQALALAGLLALAWVPGARAPVAPQGGLLDPRQLSARRDSFHIAIGDSLVGTQVTELRVEAGGLVYTEHTVIGMLQLVQNTRVVMDPATLAPRSVDQTGRVQQQLADTHVMMADGRAKGRAQTPGPGGESRITDVDTTFAAGTLDVNQFPALVPALPLADSASFTVSVFNAADASTTPFTIAVEGIDDVTVPAGTFSAYRVSVGKTGQPQLTVFVTRASPRRIVKLQAAGQQITFELVR